MSPIQEVFPGSEIGLDRRFMVCSKTIVGLPKSYRAERKYALNVLLRDLLGLEYQVVDSSEESYLQIGELKITFLDDIFGVGGLSGDSFAMPNFDYFAIPLALREFMDVRLVALLENHEPIGVPIVCTGQFLGGSAADNSSIVFNGDVLGSTFLMLTRYEELSDSDLDRHGRFQAANGVASRFGFLDIPIVNVYSELIAAAIKSYYPDYKFKKKEYKVYVTHDVDRPFSVSKNRLSKLPRVIVSDLAKRKSPALALRRLRGLLGKFFGHYRWDPNNTFDYLMAQSERRGLISSFYFIFGTSQNVIEEHYSPDNGAIRQIIRNVSDRGHLIGLHPSYETYTSRDKLRSEYEKMRDVASDEGIVQKRWGGRQHILRWQNPLTWQLWDELGLSYDSTMHFAGSPGFRDGTCSEHGLFDIKRNRELGLREKPLMIMDVSYTNYLRYTDEEILRDVKKLSEVVKILGGEFVLLWHQDLVQTKKQRKLYESILDLVVQ